MLIVFIIISDHFYLIYEKEYFLQFIWPPKLIAFSASSHLLTQI